MREEHKPKYLPTPAQIRQECRRIQAGWSPQERRKRAPWYYEQRRVRLPGLDMGGVWEVDG